MRNKDNLTKLPIFFSETDKCDSFYGTESASVYLFAKNSVY